MKKKLFTICFLLFGIGISYADQNITITGGSSIYSPSVEVMNFNNDDISSTDNLAGIISNDLNISGDLKALNITDDIQQITSKVNYILTGNISGGLISYELRMNNDAHTLLIRDQLKNFNNNIRLIAHTISNQIYQKLTKNPGAFTSKIAYIARDGHRYKIIVADYDGFNPKTIIATNSILSSLSWNPNGSQIAYVSYENGKPVVYVQYVYKPQRYVVSAFSGSNSSPSFTPSGSQLIVTLTKDGSSQLYLIDNKSFSNRTYAKPILNNHFSAINTEVNISSNNLMVFTSDHDGGPQIFMSDAMGRMVPRRLTFNLGNYNTTPMFSHDGSKITFIKRGYGVLRAYIYDIKTGSAYPVSQSTTLDMAPSFSPNDKLILFSSNKNNMYIANVTGTTQTMLNNVRFDEIIDQQWSNNISEPKLSYSQNKNYQ